MREEIVIQKKEFDCFDVYFLAEGHSFVYADFKDTDSFVEGVVGYIFKEENLLNYAKRNNKIGFIGTQKQYAKLYNNISMFLNPRGRYFLILLPDSFLGEMGRG